MNAWTAAPEQAPADAAPSGGGEGGAVVCRRQQILARMAEAGLTLVLAIEREALRASPDPAAVDAVDPAPPQSAPDAAAARLDALALDFARVSRAVRMTIALQSRLAGEARDPVRAARTRSRGGAAVDEDGEEDTLESLLAQLDEADQAEREGEEGVERRESEAERLHDRLISGERASRPIHQVLADIRRDIELSGAWGAEEGAEAESADFAADPPPPAWSGPARRPGTQRAGP